MASEWSETNVGNLLLFANGRSSPERADGLPHSVYGSNGIIGYANEANANAGAIIIGRVGSYCGSLYQSTQKCWVTDNAIRAVAKNGHNPRFLFYLLGTLALNNWRAGSGQPLLNQDILSRIPAIVPEPAEQRRIAHILGTLDDNIENNRKTAKALEAMAQAIFKSWFVDFDPVRAKMTGESRESICKRLKITPEILDLFPDRLVDSELGEIPEGWSYSRLGDVADVNWGNTRVTKKFYVNQGYLAYSATGPDGFLPYYEHDHVGVVVSAIGVNSGYTWLALGKWSTIKNTIRFWSDSADMNTEYLYLATHNINFWPLRGSAQPFISQTDARNTKILHPSKNLAKVFGESASKLFQVVHQKERKSQYLIHLRDTLLPKLISGEIRVSDAQAVVDTTANASKLFHD